MVEHASDRLAIEEPLELRIAGQPVAVTMRTPGHDAELAAGFCLTEGVVEAADEIESVSPCREAEFGNVIDVCLTEETLDRRAEALACATRESFLSSSCGVCGKQSIERVRQKVKPIRGDFTVKPSVIRSLPERMRAAQATFNETGGLHAAALFRPDGQMLAQREDVGRHNAVDKVIGHELLLNRLPIDPAVLMVSGRTSFEIIQKAAIAGVAMVCAVSAPSSLAVDFAAELGVTLVGFLRGDRMNVYTGHQRVDDGSAR